MKPKKKNQSNSAKNGRSHNRIDAIGIQQYTTGSHTRDATYRRELLPRKLPDRVWPEPPFTLPESPTTPVVTSVVVEKASANLQG